MKKFLILVTLGTIFIIVLGVILFSQGASSSTPLPSNYELYVSVSCPHCRNVEEFLDSWDKKDQIKIDKLEVDSNQINISLLAKRATYCKLPTNQLGVPFLFTPKGKCLTGDQPIIDYFKNLEL
jgi:glutaredoxin